MIRLQPSSMLKAQAFIGSPLITRPATLADVPAVMPLLNEYARRAEILPRTEGDVYQSIRDWVVTEVEGKVVGMGALLVLWHDLAEVRSLVVDPGWRGYGIGRNIVSALIEEARNLKIPTLFALTRQIRFFLKLGFRPTEIALLPRKVMKDCIFCPKFHYCDEFAVIFDLGELEPTVTNGRKT